MQTTNANAITKYSPELDISQDMPDIELPAPKPITPMSPVEFCEVSDYESDFSFGQSWALDDQ
jgi:hypothetical protein